MDRLTRISEADLTDKVAICGVRHLQLHFLHDRKWNGFSKTLRKTRRETEKGILVSSAFHSHLDANWPVDKCGQLGGRDLRFSGEEGEKQ